MYLMSALSEHLTDSGILRRLRNWLHTFQISLKSWIILWLHNFVTNICWISFFVYFSRSLQGKTIKAVYRFHVVITTFEMILADCPELRSVPWRCVVIDEAHRLKNRNCKLLEGLKMMDMVSGGATAKRDHWLSSIVNVMYYVVNVDVVKALISLH